MRWCGVAELRVPAQFVNPNSEQNLHRDRERGDANVITRGHSSRSITSSWVLPTNFGILAKQCNKFERVSRAQVICTLLAKLFAILSNILQHLKINHFYNPMVGIHLRSFQAQIYQSSSIMLNMFALKILSNVVISKISQILQINNFSV